MEAETGKKPTNRQEQTQMPLCPECNKRHTRKGKAFEKCRADSTFQLGHCIIRGFAKEDFRMIEARNRAQRFVDYEKQL